jgi:hypothetical protein
MEDRSKFVYDNGYGITTDIWILPVGTKFRVENGYWDGAITRVDGKKCLYVFDTEKHYEINDEKDFSLVIRIYEEDDFGNRRYLR